VLERLSVRGLGIIDQVDLEFGPGFVVLSGETGAGKSLLVESLKLVAGDRARTELVRSGSDRLRVEAVFSTTGATRAALAELGLDPAEEVVIRREVTATGRSRSYVNDAVVTATGLQRLATTLLAIHGQHEQYGLADPDVQRALVDRFGDLGAAAERTARAFARWEASHAEVARLSAARRGRRDRLDAIAYQIQEIDAVAPTSGEIEELTQRRQALRHAVRLQELGRGVLADLDEDEDAVVDRLAAAERALSEMVELGLAAADAAAAVSEARIGLEETVRDLRGLVGDLHEDPTALEAAESRLHALDGLCLKYGADLDDVLDHRRALDDEKAELEGVEDRLGAAVVEEAAALEAFDAVARALTGARREAAEELAAAVAAALADLEMAGARLEFAWDVRPEPGSSLLRDDHPVAFDEHGVEHPVLMLAANRGERLRPMAKVASGGELSRIHLAIRTALRRRDDAEATTLLFDEVDSGLGGRAAGALAELLAAAAGRDQVLVVTHLAQVAARATAQVRVEKAEVDGRTVTRVHRLENDERRREIARMLAGGGLTDAALAHADELLEGR
jgi:DNA repair protein RecN (Recombination protein N)